MLGKAATLNAAVGDVMLSSVIFDEHSRSTYWLDNAFSVEDIAPYLLFGSGLDNQRAVTVKSTFLQNRGYLDLYYREAFTVVEMEAGPFCNAVYEIADVDRHPTGEAVNFAKLPIDLGIIHYASDTPYTQARTLGARGLSYYGMDSTYAATSRSRGGSSRWKAPSARHRPADTIRPRRETRLPSVEADGWRVVEQTAHTAREVLAGRLGAVYAIGSLAHGGFAPAISDVDVAVLTSDGRSTESAAGEIARRVGRQGMELPSGCRCSTRLGCGSTSRATARGSRQSTVWICCDRSARHRFGRARALRAHAGRRGGLHGGDRVLPRRSVAGVVGRLRPTAGVRPTTKVVLAPVRLWHVARTGLATSNDAAVDNYLTTPGVRNARLVRAASDWRRRQAVPDRAVVAELLDEHLLDLYVEVLELVARAPTSTGGAIAHALDDLRRGPGLA